LGDVAPPRLTKGLIPAAVNPILLVHAIGRTARRPEHVRRFLHLLAHRLDNRGTLTNGDYEALGRLLGGEEAAADALSEPVAANLVKAATSHIEAENRSARERRTRVNAYRRKFRAALWLIAVVLRRRRADPRFLDPQSATAKALLRCLETARDNLADPSIHAALRTNRARKLADIVEELALYIHRRGRNAELLRVIDDLDAGDGDGDE